MAIDIHVRNFVQSGQRRRIQPRVLPGHAQSGHQLRFDAEMREIIDDRLIELAAVIRRHRHFLNPERPKSDGVRLHRSHHRQADLFRELRRPPPLEIETLEQERRCAADGNDIAADLLQLNGEFFGFFEAFEKALAPLAAKTDEGRHDLDTLRRVFIPVGKRLAAVGRLDQTNACAPGNHLTTSPILDGFATIKWSYQKSSITVRKQFWFGSTVGRFATYLIHTFVTIAQLAQFRYGPQTLGWLKRGSLTICCRRWRIGEQLYQIYGTRSVLNLARSCCHSTRITSRDRSTLCAPRANFPACGNSAVSPNTIRLYSRWND